MKARTGHPAPRSSHGPAVLVPPPGQRRTGAGSGLLARAVTGALAPVPLVAAMQLLLGWAGRHHQAQGLVFGAAAVAMTIVPPYAFVLHGARRGRFTGHHIGDHRQRPLPLLLGAAASAAGIAILALAGAPRLLIAGAAATGIGLLLGAVISRSWKMSGHTAAATAVLVICAAAFHGWPLLAAPLVAVTGWSRVKLGDHTTAQVTAGIVFGAVIAAVAMPPLAGW